MALWNWLPTIRRYALTSAGAKLLGRRPGFVSARTILSVRRKNIISHEQEARQLMDTYLEGGSLTSFVEGMRGLISNLHIQQFMLATGGEAAWTPQSAGKVGGLIRRHNNALNRFTEKLANGEITPGQARVNASYYARAGVNTFERGSAFSRGVNDLPTWPGEQQCHTNCNCEWVWVDAKDHWEVWWKLNPGDHCTDCEANAEMWKESNPLVYSKPILEMA